MLHLNFVNVVDDRVERGFSGTDRPDRGHRGASAEPRGSRRAQCQAPRLRSLLGLVTVGTAIGLPGRCTPHPADLAMALVSSNVSYRFLDQRTRAEMARRLDEILEEERVFGTPVDVYVYSDPVKRILAYALEEAQHNGEVQAQPRHVLIGLLREEDCAAARLFQSHGIDLIRVRSLQ